jgi:PAS domain S-box-containing protein
MSTAAFHLPDPGRAHAAARQRGAILGLAAAAPAAAVLGFIVLDEAIGGRIDADGGAILVLVALATLGLGAWIGSFGLGRAAVGEIAPLADLLRRIAAGETAPRRGGPYAAGEIGDLEQAEMLERYRQLAELSSDVFFRLAPDATFLAVSRTIKDLLGYEPQEMIGRSCYDFLHAEDLADARRKHDELLSSGRTAATLRLRRRSGGYVSVEFSSGLRREAASGRPLEIVGLARDVTDRAEQARELDRVRRDVATSGRSRSSFLAHMSHDLRTPLNIIIGLSQIIRDQMFGPVGAQRYVDYARDIESSGHDLLDLINDLLDLSKVEAGRWQLEERAVSLQRSVEAVFTMVSARSRLAEVTLESRLDAELPLVLADERAVRQTLLAVVSSTLKRVEPSSAIAIEGQLIRGQVILVVKGRSRPAESHDGYVKDPLDGSVGLALASDLMRLHGGRLDLQTTGDERLTVTLAFPAERSLTAPARPLALAKAG